MGASRSVLIKGRTPATITDGTQLVSSAFIDPDNTVTEENDINNLELMTTTVRAQSDLQITGEVTKSNVQRFGPEFKAGTERRR